jgi:hypothetical protein
MADKDQELKSHIPVKRGKLKIFLGAVPGVYVSSDSGKNWVRIKANMPNVPVQDMAIQPRESDLIVATFGRGAWITNIAAMRDMTDDNLNAEAYLFPAQLHLAGRGRRLGNGDLYGDRFPTNPNEAPATLTYYLRDAVAEKGKVKIVITDAAGKTVREIQGEGKAGLNTVNWDMMGGRFRPIQNGDYTATLQVGDKKLTQSIHVSIENPESLIPVVDTNRD